jgi:transposase
MRGIYLLTVFPESVRHPEERAYGLIHFDTATSDWLEKTATSGLSDFRNFATSLANDQDAMLAALSVSWSSGPVEGHVNRLKLIKREMFGRGKLDLLKKLLCYRTA